MKPTRLLNYAEGDWCEGAGDFAEIPSAVTGEPVAELSSKGLDFAAMADFARRKGSPALRRLTFHDRAFMLKDLAKYLNERKDALYELNFDTGATKSDGWIDIDGGISTLFVYSSKGRREMPDDKVYIDGGVEQLSRSGTFLGRHIATPLQGVAVHINAFNFPVWGMLEKLAPTLLAGMPAIVKPASATAYLAEAAFRMIIESEIFPEGAVQLIAGSAGDLLDHLTCQDVVSFTGSVDTAMKLQSHPVIARESTRFIAERDSLNATLLAPDAEANTPEFELFVKEVVKEMTVKAGQKCTAIRRVIVPRNRAVAVVDALSDALGKVEIGDPRRKETRMGALVSQSQRGDVKEKIEKLHGEAEIVHGNLEDFSVVGADKEKGAFLPPVLLYCSDPWEAKAVHETEAFGPVSTVIPYDDLEDAIALANRGQGSLVASVFTHNPDNARQIALGMGAYHGRIIVIDRDCAKEQTGHGSPLPHMIHGGPGRAGGGEEMGGIRGALHYMQRTAIQGSPAMLTGITNSWTRGGPEIDAGRHPFRLHFEEVEIGTTLHTESREVTLEDIEHFAEFTGDKFYAHMDEEAAAANPFFPGRVAHGYLLLSFAAGLFVDPDPGPVLANYGLDNLRFLKPVSPGERMKVRLTAKQKTSRNEEYGEVRWDVEVTDSEDEIVAQYDLLTMNAKKGGSG